MIQWWVQLNCHACLATFRTLVEARPCDDSPTHMHFTVDGPIGLWSASHHLPALMPLGPASTRRTL